MLASIRPHLGQLVASSSVARALRPLSLLCATVSATVAEPASLLSQGAPELPRGIPQVPANLATAACTQKVSGSGLQSAVKRAKGGAVLCLDAGERFTGQLVLPQRGDNGWVVIRTAPASSHPAPGTRIRPSQSSSLAQLATAGGAPALASEPGARGWYLALLDITIDPDFPKVTSTIVNFVRGSSDLVLDRAFVHAGTEQNVQRCVVLNSAATTVINSWLDDCHGKGFDSQAILSWESDGPVLVDNNTLAGAGENVMLGGADPKEPGVQPTDFTFTRNHIVTPPEWNRKWSKKNVFETKNARRVLIEGNVIEGSWVDGQIGYALVLKTANQGGRCTWCSSSDVTIRRNFIRRAAGVFWIIGKDRGVVDSLTRRFLITENWAEEIGEGMYGGALQLVSIVQGATDFTIERNTLLGGNIKNDFMVSPPVRSGIRLVFRRNVLSRGRYSLHGCGGPIANCLPGAQLSGNVFVGPGGGMLGPGFSTAGSLAGALGGAGVQKSVVDAATKGVIVTP